MYIVHKYLRTTLYEIDRKWNYLVHKVNIGT